MGNCISTNKKSKFEKVPLYEESIHEKTTLSNSDANKNKISQGIKLVAEYIKQYCSSKIARTRKRPFSLIDDSENCGKKICTSDIQNCQESDISDISEIDNWPTEELQKLLETEDSLSPVSTTPSEDQIEPVLYYADPRELGNLEKEDLRIVMKSALLQLGADEKLFERFKIVVNIFIKRQLLEEVMELRDDYNNLLPIYCLSHKNWKAFCYLYIRKKFDIEEMVVNENYKMSVLIMVGQQFPFILEIVVNFLLTNQPKEAKNFITKYGSDDNNFIIWLINNLSKAQNKSADIILNCIRMIFEKIPDLFTENVVLVNEGVSIDLIIYISFFRENGIKILKTIKDYLNLPDTDIYIEICENFYRKEEDLKEKYIEFFKG